MNLIGLVVKWISHVFSEEMSYCFMTEYNVFSSKLFSAGLVQELI